MHRQIDQREFLCSQIVWIPFLNVKPKHKRSHIERTSADISRMNSQPVNEIISRKEYFHIPFLTQSELLHDCFRKQHMHSPCLFQIVLPNLQSLLCDSLVNSLSLLGLYASLEVNFCFMAFNGPVSLSLMMQVLLLMFGKLDHRFIKPCPA